MAQPDEQAQRPLGGGGALGAARAFAIWWVLCAALWLLLTDGVSLPNLVAGAVVAVLGATASVLVRSQRQVILRPRLRWLLAAARPLLALVGDLVPLVRALVTRGLLRRAGTGELMRLPFASGGSDERERSAYRALTSALGSLGPNTIVVELEDEAGLATVHQLVRTPDPAARALPLPPP